ncbi:hypothetical protein GCM10009007_04640 [Formosimonas limnophila]|uniref:Uncharacterized protein n=1 Tax=Formosimonas limnophila TaxID=1384487 RepID=A0A8J3CMI3_9BURK|nr:hypothetical protein GCM10009007_04640 [Formosimonas limnophila]
MNLHLWMLAGEGMNQVLQITRHMVTQPEKKRHDGELLYTVIGELLHNIWQSWRHEFKKGQLYTSGALFTNGLRDALEWLFPRRISRTMGK